MSRTIVDQRFFEQPGFTELFDAYSNMFERKDDGQYKIPPDEALAGVMKVRHELDMQYLLATREMNQIERIACKYAIEMSIMADELEYENENEDLAGYIK